MRKIKINYSRRKLILTIFVVLILAAGVIVLSHNDHWYTTPIVKIEKTSSSLYGDSQAVVDAEQHYRQSITGIVLNGTYRGQRVQMTNTYSSSRVYDDEYKPGDKVFVNIDPANHGEATIVELKRDQYFFVLIALFILLAFLTAGKKGVFALISLGLNIALFLYALELYSNGHNILILTNFLILLFTLSSLLFISGFKKRTYIAILSTLITIFFTMALFKIVLFFTDGVDYAFMEYIASPSDLPDIFLSQMLLGGLGAIMDVAVTEASTINELVQKNNEISYKELFQSGKEVGHDIMGTMINVMLFTYISGSIPLIILKMNNDIRLHTIILWHMPMELYRFLIGSIGILMTIPISLVISMVFFKKIRRFA